VNEPQGDLENVIEVVLQLCNQGRLLVEEIGEGEYTQSLGTSSSLHPDESSVS
jgi:hypothetical protein